MPTVPTSFYATDDILTILGIDPNQQYIPVRHILRSVALTPTSYERAVRRIPVLAAGLKPSGSSMRKETAYRHSAYESIWYRCG